MTFQIFVGLLALAVVVLILWLIRHERLPINRSLWWLAVALVIGIFGLFPQLVDQMAQLVGVNYPPALLFTLAILTLLIKLLLEDMEVAAHQRRILRLAQKTAMLEEKIGVLQEQLEKRRDRQES
jgi:hypothetical protein